MKRLTWIWIIFFLLFGIAGCNRTGLNETTTAIGGSVEDVKNETEGTEPSVCIERNGTYDSADEVALYLVTYHMLPSNYITKEEAKKLGWKGGSLEEFAPGKCIGGDVFGNREGLLPKSHDYHECDIDSIGKEKRSSKRLVYSEDFEIYYTEDHYSSFTKLY